jgi:hypothetical protein
LIIAGVEKDYGPAMDGLTIFGQKDFPSPEREMIRPGKVAF